MRWIKRIVLGLIGIVVVLVGISYFLPNQAQVSRSITIDATPAQVFPYVNSLRKFNEWSPWAQLDPDMEQTFTGPDEGPGQMLSWQSDNPQVGSGSQTITESEPDRRVAVELDFGEMGTADSAWELAQSGAGTEVIWSFESELGYNPFMRYMGLMFDSVIGADYEKGLAALKTLVESESDGAS
jgi:hypothetical protein